MYRRLDETGQTQNNAPRPKGRFERQSSYEDIRRKIKRRMLTTKLGRSRDSTPRIGMADLWLTLLVVGAEKGGLVT